MVVLEDNSEEVSLDSSVPYEAKTKKATLGLELSESGFCKKFNFTDSLYLGIIKNSEHKEMAMDYILYLHK